MPVAANPHVGAVLPLSVTALERWDRCRRQYLLRDLLAVAPPVATAPASGEGGATTADPTFGLAVHRLLESVHREGACGDVTRTQDLARVVEPSVAPQLATLAARHADRCPGTAADWSAHEYGAARFNRRPDPLFMLTGRIDALWAHGGVLAAHDYKTGTPRVQRLGDLLAARVQAWLLAPLAAERGLRIRIVFEHLDTSVHDQPDPYEPEDEDLAAIGDELRAIASAIRDETRFTGSGDPADCRWCAYRAVCRDAPPTGRATGDTHEVMAM
ncbi:MAG TPA: PD-(D/E)XK nuclease family protein [Acidimicrobiales bacterium]|nr:PD-(D/E)XK nuclease family protein [Acidimicrobiales bacterium]